MSSKLVFFKGDISFPTSAYLVFVFPDQTTKVTLSSEIEEVNGTLRKCTFRSFLADDEYIADVDRMELMINNGFVNHVRWFDVEESGGGVFAVSIKKYEPQVPWIKYLGTICTAGILGCAFLREQNEDIKRIAVHLDRAQKELCDGSALRAFGQRAQEIFGSRDVEHLQEIKRNYDAMAGSFAEEDIRAIRKIGEGLEGWEKLERDLEELGRYGDFEFIKDRLELGQKVFQVFGIDSVEQLQELKDKYVSALNHRPASSDLGISYNDEQIIRKLQSRSGGLHKLDQDLDVIQEYGSFESIRKKLEFEKEVSRMFGTGDIEELRKIKQKHVSTTDELETTKRELNDFGSLEDREIIKKLRYYDGGFAGLARDINELRDHGGLKGIREQLDFGKEVSQLFGSSDIEILKKEKKDIARLEQQRDDRDNDLARWKAIANGKSLDYMEEISRKSVEAGKTNQGKVLEQQIEEILSKIDSYDSENNFDWEPQYQKGNDKLDFLVDIKNKHGQNFRIVIECKWHGSKYDEELGHFAEGGVDKEAPRQTIKSWTQQLCGYYNQTKADIGLLVTNVSIGGCDKQDLISHIPKTYIHDDYKEQGMHLMVVHHSSFEQLISVIRFVMNVCKPQIEITLTTEQMEKYHSDPVIREGLMEIMKSYQQAFGSWTKARKKVDSLEKDVTLIRKYMTNFDKHINIQHEQIKRFQINSEVYSERPLQLEGTTMDAVIEEEIEESAGE